MKSKPVYISAGFIESGKTTLLKEMISDKEFLQGDRVLVICTEEGTVEFEDSFMSENGAGIIYVDEIGKLTPRFFKNAEKKYDFDLVFIEFNGMWNLEDIFPRLPRNWPIVQIFTTVDYTTYNMYMANMRSLIMNIIKLTDVVIVNRCSDVKELGSVKRALRGANSRANIIFEDTGGNIITDIEELLPYDINADIIDVDVIDFGILFIDMQDHPEKYEGKKISFTAMAYKEDQMPPGMFFAGRMAMACCAQDAQFIGFACYNNSDVKIRNRKYYRITGELRFEKNMIYVDEGPVIHAGSITEAAEPEDGYVYFS